MPDFTYVAYRPFITRVCSASSARDLTVKLLELQGRIASGRKLFRWMAHATPPRAVGVEALGLTFPSPVGIGAHIDLDGGGLRLWSHLGAGFVIVGPVASDTRPNPVTAPRLIYPMCSVVTSDDARCGSFDQVRQRLADPLARTVPVGVALAGDQLETLLGGLGPLADFYTVPATATASLSTLRRRTDRPLLLQITAHDDEDVLLRRVDKAARAGFEGCVAVDGGHCDLLSAGRVYGPGLRDRALSVVDAVHRRFGSDLVIIGGGGILTPEDSAAFLQAGATLTHVFEGLVYAGPGLPNRTNRLLAATHDSVSNGHAGSHVVQPALAEAPSAGSPAVPELMAMGGAARPVRRTARPTEATSAAKPLPAPMASRATWIGLGLVSATAALLITGGLLALALAATMVLMPHELVPLQLSIGDLQQRSPGPLIAFMAHNRVCFAGALTGLGVVYWWLARVPLKNRESWAWWALLISCVAGPTAFLAAHSSHSLRDPLYFATTGVLALAFITGLVLTYPSLPARDRSPVTLLRAGAYAWLWSPAGLARAFLGVWGAGLVLGGALILFTSVTCTLVPQDEEYLGFGVPTIRQMHQLLVGLVAKDRMAFGACLLAGGLVVIPSIWCGVQPGRPRLLKTFGLAAFFGVVVPIGVHPIIGYMDAIHLFPFVVMAVAAAIGVTLLRRPLMSLLGRRDRFHDLWVDVDEARPVTLAFSRLERGRGKEIQS